MTKRDIDNFIGDFAHEVSYIKGYEQSFVKGHIQVNLRPEARRIKKLLKDIKKTVVLLKVIRKQYE